MLFWDKFWIELCLKMFFFVVLWLFCFVFFFVVKLSLCKSYFLSFAFFYYYCFLCFCCFGSMVCVYGVYLIEMYLCLCNVFMGVFMMCKKFYIFCDVAFVSGLNLIKFFAFLVVFLNMGLIWYVGIVFCVLGFWFFCCFVIYVVSVVSFVCKGFILRTS